MAECTQGKSIQLTREAVKQLEKWSPDPKAGPLGEGAESGRGGRGRPQRFEREQVNSWTVRHIMRMIFQPALGPFPSPHKWANDSAPTRLPSLEGIFGATFHCCQGLPTFGFRPFTNADLEIQPVDISGTLCVSVGHSTRFPLKIYRK